VILTGVQVLIWGFGRHGGGLAAARHCAAQGAQVRILDQQPASALGADGAAAQAAGWPWAIGGSDHPWFAAADLIVPSPAIPPRVWPKAHPRVLSPEALAFAAHRGPRVAVTGTKGKSTTARILGALLGWPVAGNSYEPLLAALARLGLETPLVCELSSFQLHYLRAEQPRFAGAVVTNLAVDHLDWHGAVADYRASKLALLDWSDRCVIGPGCPTTAAASQDDVQVSDEAFLASDGSVLAHRSDLALLGRHNADNAALALTLALALGLDPALIPARLRQVTALPHRLQTVHHGRWIWIDDSIATTPEAAMAALAAVSGPLAIIVGGGDKGAIWDKLAHAVAARGASAYAIGRTGPALATAIGAAGGTVRLSGTLPEAVTAAIAALPEGGTVLLSPACSSLDQFTSFEDRGDRFTALARAHDGLRAAGAS